MSVFDKIKRVFGGKSTGNKTLPVDVSKAVGYEQFENYYSSGDLSNSLYFNNCLDYIVSNLSYFSVFKEIDPNLLRRSVYDYFIFGQVCFYKDGYDGQLHILRGHSITYVYNQDDGLEKFVGTNEWNKSVELFPFEAGFISRPRINDYLYGVRQSHLLQSQLDIEQSIMSYAQINAKTASLGAPIVSYDGDLPTRDVFEQNTAILTERNRLQLSGVPKIQHLAGSVKIETPDLHNVDSDFQRFNDSIKSNIYEYFGLSSDSYNNMVNCICPLQNIIIFQLRRVGIFTEKDILNALEHPIFRAQTFEKSSGIVQLWNIGVPLDRILQELGLGAISDDYSSKSRFQIEQMNSGDVDLRGNLNVQSGTGTAQQHISTTAAS